MQRLLSYFRQYSSFLHPEAVAYLTERGKVKHYKKGQVYKLENEAKSHWCFILDGMVGKVCQDSKGRIHTDRISIAQEYYVGTRHPYTRREDVYGIVFLQDSSIYEIKNSDLQHLVEGYHCINRVYHILKQHKLDKTQDILYIRSLYFEQRIAAFYLLMPRLAALLSVAQKRDFLHIANNRDYYIAQRYYLRQP